MVLNAMDGAVVGEKFNSVVVSSALELSGAAMRTRFCPGARRMLRVLFVSDGAFDVILCNRS